MCFRALFEKLNNEQNMDIIQISLDLLVIITKYQNGRELLREHKIYYVIRDMHMGKRD